MDKNEILEKSRLENKNQDLYEKEVMKKASNIATIIVAILCAIFTVIEILRDNKTFLAFEAILFSLMATQFIYKAVKFRRKHEIVVASLYGVAAVMFIAAYLISLFI